MCQALASIGMPYSPAIYYTSNNMGKAFFWLFALFPWNPLTKGVLDMSAAAMNAGQQGNHPAHCMMCTACSRLGMHAPDLPFMPLLQYSTEWPHFTRVCASVDFLAGLRFSDRHSYCQYVPDPSKPPTGADMSWLYQDKNCIFSIEQCYWVLLVQTVAWMLAAVYFDNIQPNRHGVRMPWYYPLMPSYWRNMLRGGATGQPGSGAGASRAGSQGGAKQHSPFAAPDAARKVAKAISGVKEEEQLVIRCTSSAGSAGGTDAIAARGLTGVATQGSVASTARHSVSSGMLRRRDNRPSDPAGAGGSIAGELVTLPSRSQAAGTASGRYPQYAGQQLMVNPSATAMRLSDASLEAVHIVHTGTAAAGTSSMAPGTTISLQQYQQLQVDSKRRAAASKRWWEFWRHGEDSLTSAAKKHDSMVAAVSAGQPAPGGHSKGAAGQYGVTPVVLDAGVLQEEQRMKAALFGGGLMLAELVPAWRCYYIQEADIACLYWPGSQP